MLVSPIYSQASKTRLRFAVKGHSPSVRKARQPGPVTVLRGVAAQLLEGAK